jgi:hypothetical protein
VAAGAAQRSTVRALAGCYTLDLSPWSPAHAPGADSAAVTLPRRIALDTALAGGRFAAGSYQVGVIGDDARPVGMSATWAPIAKPSPAAPDSVQILWSTGFRGVRLRLAHEGGMLRGEAATFGDVDRPDQRSTVRATRIACPRD